MLPPQPSVNAPMLSPYQSGFLVLVLAITVTYGLVESKLLTPLRVVWLMVFPRPGHLLHGFLHCAYCTGWWVTLVLAALLPLGLSWTMVLVLPSCYITMLLFLRIFTGRELYHPPYQAEFGALEALHEPKK